MSTVDPAVARARQQERQKGGIGSLLGTMAAAAGCLVTGYLFGRGFAGIFGVFRWMASQGINSMSSSEGPPYFWGVFVGVFVGLAMMGWYGASSRTFTGGVGLPISGLSLTAAGATYGVWLQGVQWSGLDGYPDNPQSGAYASFMEHGDQWLPLTFAVVTALVLAGGVWLWIQRNARGERARTVLETGRRARGVVTEAAWTGMEISSRKLIRFTVTFTDQAGVQRWVTKKATFDPTAMPSAGMQATVFYDPARMDEDKILVTLEPLEVVEQKLGDAARPATPQDAAPVPPWGSPSDGFYRGDTGNGYYRGDSR